MIETLRPWLRAIYYDLLRRSAEFKIWQSSLNELTTLALPPTFLIGCGRSGTTILGRALSCHPNILYLFEPYHLWAALDPITDVLNLYHRIDAHLIMNASHCTEQSPDRFNSLFLKDSRNTNGSVLIEKTPLNAMRIGYLNALSPSSKFIHIIRDGVDVAYSIDRIALTNSYKIVGKPKLNQWWGVENYKWKALARDGAAAGYYADELHQLKDHRSKGAYEWLVSLAEVDRARQQLGDRLYEMTYDQLTANPKAALQDIFEFLGLNSPTALLDQAASMIDPTSHSIGKFLSLPPAMCEAFNSYQESFGFSNRAVPLPV